jgi:RNase P subunit RPR2
MRDRKRDLCPRCHGLFGIDPYSDRTVRGGTWYVARCHNCGHVEDVFVPRRSKMKKQAD